MTSFRKPEVHNMLHCRHGHSWYVQEMSWNLAMRCLKCEWTDRQTDKQTCWWQYFINLTS